MEAHGAQVQHLQERHGTHCSMQEETDNRILKQRASRRAFYPHEAVADARDYIAKCWQEYTTDEGADMADYGDSGSSQGISNAEHSSDAKPFMFPCGAILQSSGMGKSRLLDHLAGTSPFKNTDVRVLTSSYEESKETELLNHLLFTGSCQDLANNIFAAFECAMVNWNHVMNRWSRRMSAQDCDTSTSADVEAFQREHYETEPIDAVLEFWTDPDQGRRLLVIAVDEAFEMVRQDHQEETLFKRFRQALRIADTRIAEVYGRNKRHKAGVFGLFVDTSSHITNFHPTSPSYELFPPFILVQTQDMMVDWAKTNLSSLPDGIERLKYYGRPLWASLDLDFDRLIKFAARTLVRGRSNDVYVRETKDGVASFFCRLGSCPNSFTKFASDMTANFMACLTYVDPSCEEASCGYIS